MPGSRYDAFVSYAHHDAAWVQVLADNLHRAGLEVFLDSWEIATGDRLADRLQDGLARSRTVVFVVSSTSVTRPWWQEESAAAAISAAVEGAQRLVAVLLDDVALPPFLASRVRVDFRHTDGPDAYRAAFDALVRAIGDRPQAERPERDGRLVLPPGRYRAEGARPARLRIGPDAVVFSTEDGEERHAPAGPDAGLRSAVLDLTRARARGAVILRGDQVGGGLHAALLDVGRRLGACFLDGAAGQALAAAVDGRGNASLRLAVQVDDPALADLPWESLVLPGRAEPLVLTRGVELHRAVEVPDPPAPSIPGPLRILAVIASPDSGGGELLDHEAELARILAAVDPSRRRDGAHVRILNWGSPAAVRAALAQERFHVLHMSCHAEPGRLVLESDTGAAETIDAERFVRDVLVPDEPVPLVVLAGCSTALGAIEQRRPTDGREAGEAPAGPDAKAPAAGERALPGFARDLLHAGVPAVLAMTAPVTDGYATDLCATLYGELARRPQPVPLAELTTVRRRLEDARRTLPANDPRGAWAEWATPALFQAGPALPLYTHTVETPARPETRVQLGGMIRKVGDFVGRRAELRAILRDLRRDVPGVVLHGIGGIGKSSLAAEVAGQLGADAGLVVPVSGTTRVDLILDEIRQRLLALAVNLGLDDRHPLRQVVTALIDATPPWEQRLALLAQVVLPQLPILLLLDNAEDLLRPDDTAWTLADDQLAAFLAAWVRTDRARLVVTTRYPFPLPGRAHRRLPHHHLGPLSEAETRKLIWRLPALDTLDPAQRRRAYTDVGGHPRSLEYLDALLAGGDARFDDVADRIETALEARGVTDLDTWLDGVEGDLDRALAETVTLAADDVLLDALLARLDPLARRLLLGAAVYRLPVDDIGLQWQVAKYREPEPDPERDQRMAETDALLTRARQENLSPADVGITEEMVERWSHDVEQLRRPPLDIPDGVSQARETLLRLGLLAPVSAEANATVYVVHRWTATALIADVDEMHVVTAHRRAAQHWQWRVDVWPQDRSADIAQLVEVRHHHHEAGDTAAAVVASYSICEQLHTWGAWTWEEDLCTDTLTWLPGATLDRAAFRHQLGLIAQLRGNYDRAEQQFQAALTITEECGDPAGVATGYHQLGIIAQLRGDYDRAEEQYRASLTIKQELGDRAGIARSYHQLGRIAELRGDHDHAEQQYQASLTIEEQLGDPAGIAVSYHQLAMIAQRRGDHDHAEQQYRAALTIHEKLGDRVAIAAGYYQLGMIAQHRGSPDRAEQQYRAALTIAEELGDRAGIARCYHQLGVIAEMRGDRDRAEGQYRTALTLHEELGEPVGIATTASNLGAICTVTERAAEGIVYTLTALSLNITIRSPDVNKDFYWLGQQRAALGDPEFRRILAEHLDPESVEHVINALPAPDED